MEPSPSPSAVVSEETLFFAEVAEGGSFNKWIELYNPTDEAVALDDIEITLIHSGLYSGRVILGNGSSFSNPTGVDFIAPNAHLVICNPWAIESVDERNSRAVLTADDCDLVEKLINNFPVITKYNGDDSLILYVKETLVDVFGQSSTSSTEFTVCGNSSATKDKVLVRKSDVCRGNVEDLASFGTSNSDCEWSILPINNIDNVNAHEANCGKKCVCTDVKVFVRMVKVIVRLVSCIFFF